MSPSRARPPRARLRPVHLPGRLTASAALLLHHGAAADPPGREGTAATWAVLLRRDRVQEQHQGGAAEGLEIGLEELGTALTLDVGWRTVRIGLDSTPEHLADALALLARTLDAFRPEPQEIRALAHRRGLALAAARRAPGGSAGPLLDAALFLTSRYGRGKGGDADSATRIDADAIRAFHQGVLQAPRDLVIAADLTRVGLRTLARRCPAQAPDLPVGTGQPEEPVGQVCPLTVRHDTGAGTCVVMIGVRAVARGDAAVAMEIARRLLASTASSRLSRTLRGTSALAYAVHSEAWKDGAVCALRLRFAVAPTLAPSTAATALGELFGLAARELDPNDLRSAIEAGGWGATTADPATVAARAGLSLSGTRPPLSLTPGRFRAAAGELIRPDRVAVVLDGTPHGMTEMHRAVLAAAAQDPQSAPALRAYAHHLSAFAAAEQENEDATPGEEK